MAEVWERQPGESSRAYAAFCIYRDLGPARSLDKALAQANKKPSNRRHWARWMERYRWLERAQAYDDYIERIKREEQEKEILDMAQRHARLAVAFQQKIAERLMDLDPKELSPRDLSVWLDVATKLERLSRGEPTEIGKQEMQGQVTQRYEYDITQRIISDPEAVQLAEQLLRRVAHSDAGASGLDRE